MTVLVSFASVVTFAIMHPHMQVALVVSLPGGASFISSQFSLNIRLVVLLVNDEFSVAF
jgi:hypothetical protein